MAKWPTGSTLEGWRCARKSDEARRAAGHFAAQHQVALRGAPRRRSRGRGGGSSVCTSVQPGTGRQTHLLCFCLPCLFSLVHLFWPAARAAETQSWLLTYPPGKIDRPYAQTQALKETVATRRPLPPVELCAKAQVRWFRRLFELESLPFWLTCVAGG